VSTLGIEINDRALAIASGGRVLSVAPAVVHRGGTAAGMSAIGAWRARPADVSALHWHALAEETVPSAMTLGLAGADLRQRLAALGGPTPGASWIAAGAGWSPSALSRVLGVARSLALPVGGFVDAAVATVAALDLAGPAVVVELGLHTIAATAVDAGPEVRRRRALRGEAGGLVDLYDAWLSLAAGALVRRTRFDPLHDAAAEQRLFDALPAALQSATRDAVARIAVEDARGVRHEAELARDQFTEAAERIWRELERLLHVLRPAGAAVTIVVPEGAAGLPGLRQRLDRFADCTLVVVPDGWAAAAVSALPTAGDATESGVRLLRRLPRVRETLEAGAVPRVERLGARVRESAATHVLHEGRAVALTADDLIVGRAGHGGTIELPDGLAGVSRRHCTLRLEGREAILVDHSRHGTLVNGERVAGRTRLRAGDRIRLGEPAIELPLIAIGGGDATAA
jgi:hypothetical protein